MKNLKNLYLFPVVINLFDGNTNTTDDSGLSGEMKTFYSDYLIQMAEPELIHAQFGQKHPIPKNGGKTIEFRKYDSLPKALVPLSEGVTPDGQKLSMSTITSQVKQYGGYVELSDVLILTAIDNNLTMAIELLGAQAGKTLDTVYREVLNGGTSVLYANGKEDRSELTGGNDANNDYLKVVDVRKAVRFLKSMNAPKIDGYYIGIIHPDVAFDLMSDNEWRKPHEYVDTKNLYEGEIGEIAGVRFVETTEAKVFHADDLVPADGSDAALKTVTVASYASKVVTIDEKLSANQASALAGRSVIIGGELSVIASAQAGAAGSAKITLKDAPSRNPADGDIVYPGEAGANGRDVYSTLILGKDAYGVTEVTGGGLQHIVKQLGSGDDPLNQRATAGWKATATAERLVEQYMVRVESASTFEFGEN